MIGRFIFGMGKDTVIICRQVAVSQWFVGQEWGLAFGIWIGVTNFSIALNFYLAALVEQGAELTTVWSFGLFFWLCSFLSWFIFTKFQKHAEEWAALQFHSDNKYTEKFNCSSLKKMKVRFWILWLIVLWLYLSKSNFLRIMTFLFSDRYEYEGDTIYITGITYLIPSLVWPTIGILIDKKGHQITVLIISWFMYSLSYFLFFILPAGWHVFAIIILIMFSISFSMFVVCLWSLVPLVVTPNVIGTGYGIMTACQFFGVTISPLLFGIFIDKDNEAGHIKDGLLIIFIVFSIFATLLSILLFIINFLYIKNQRPLRERYRSYNERLQKYSNYNTDDSNTDHE